MPLENILQNVFKFRYLFFGLIACISLSLSNDVSAIENATPFGPTTNYYQWVNNEWLKNTTIPADKPGVSNFLQMNNEVTKELEDLLTSLEKKPAKSPAEQKISTIYSSYMDMNRRNAVGINPLLPELRKIDEAKNHKDVAVLFAQLQKMGVLTPLVYEVSTDYKNSEKYIIFAGQAGLGIERESHLGDDERSAKIRKLYQEAITKVFELASISNADAQSKSVVALEHDLAQIQWSNVENRNIQKTYNITDFKGLKSIGSNLAVEKQFAELGLPRNYPINLMQLTYVKAFNKFFIAYDVETWKAYLKTRLLFSYAKLLDEKFNAVVVNYEIQRGLYEVEEPLAKQAVGYLNGNFGMLLGKTYIENYFDEGVKNTLKEIIKNISDEYRVAIKGSHRMTAQTKNKALDKLDKITYKIGYPDKWLDYSSVEPVAGDLVGNHMLIQKFEAKRNVNKLGKPIDKNDWGRPPQVVNAFYNPTDNSFVLLAGILHPPFFSPKGSDAEHYGGVGFVIGHEIGHAFDDQGSRFDGKGNMVNWWTKHDSAEFDKVKNKLIAQANNYELRPGKHLNGALEVGEIMGDLSGAEIALRAYQKIVKAKKLDKEQASRDFFKQLATTWRDKLREDILLLHLDKDVHPPSEFRANGIVKNFDEFHEVFHTKPGDTMYMPPAERVKIW